MHDPNADRNASKVDDLPETRKNAPKTSAEPSQMSAAFLRALQDPRRNAYLGSVPWSTRQKNRAANKVSKQSRRVNRGRR